MSETAVSTTPSPKERASVGKRIICFAGIVLIIAAAIVRSSITTSLDSFTFDEAYHIGAGAAYVQTGDFRLNPEQPPLTKLWVGAYVTFFGYQLSPYREFADKGDERDFVEQDAYFNNDPFVLQTRARTAMFALNALLLLLASLAVWRAFGYLVSLVATGYLAIDPTVAAHMPVVMTDLPVGLASAAALLFAAVAFKSWRPVDVVMASVALGLALGAKQSAVLTFIAIGLAGTAAALVFSRGAGGAPPLFKRFGAVGAILFGSLLILWGLYSFRFYETPGTAEETFNRPLEQKISDVRSPVYRYALRAANGSRLLPRAYVWGMADTIRAGVDGRAIPILAFGQMHYSRAPFYYFPGAIAAKLPIGLLLLTLLGTVLLALRYLPREFYLPIGCYAVFGAILLFFLSRGSSYAGVRHALALYPLCAALGGIAVHYFVSVRSKPMLIGSALLAFAAIASSVPVMRPWEYFNEFAGGPEGAYQYFSDEGTDLGLRLAEISEYYERELKPSGEIPYLMYFSSRQDRLRRGLDWVGNDLERDAARIATGTYDGTIIVGAENLTPKLWWDTGTTLRGVEPAARMGNVFVFKGTFDRPNGALARALWFRAMYTKLYVAEPDIASGVELLRESMELDPTAFCVSLELGNQYLNLGRREDALNAYRIALENAPRTDSIYDLIREQVDLLQSSPDAEIAPIRNPGVE